MSIIGKTITIKEGKELLVLDKIRSDGAKSAQVVDRYLCCDDEGKTSIIYPSYIISIED